jgi:hypothetical protein
MADTNAATVAATNHNDVFIIMTTLSVAAMFSLLRDHVVHVYYRYCIRETHMPNPRRVKGMVAHNYNGGGNNNISRTRKATTLPLSWPLLNNSAAPLPSIIAVHPR